MQEKNFKTLQSKRSKRREQSEHSLPAIPEKRYFTISEVSYLCGVKSYVLRYWEQEFPQLKPIKRRGNRRYYQQQDVLLIREIKQLLYKKGFTIEGARTQLAKGNKTEQPPLEIIPTDSVQKIIAELELILQGLKASEVALG